MEINIRQAGSVKIFDLVGSFDRSANGCMRQAVYEATASQPAQIVVNLQGVYYLDSSGLSVLAAGLKRARMKQGNLCLCGLRPSVRMIFELTRFDRIFGIYGNEEAAVRAAANKF
jgi:anti-anti-sigma factor